MARWLQVSSAMTVRIPNNASIFSIAISGVVFEKRSTLHRSHDPWGISFGHMLLTILARGHAVPAHKRPAKIHRLGTDILLMDEPSMGLSPILVDQQFELIQKVNRQGTTIFMVEQNANMALSIADRGYVLQTGSIVLSDTAPNLLCNEMMQEAYLGGADVCETPL